MWERYQESWRAFPEIPQQLGSVEPPDDLFADKSRYPAVNEQAEEVSGYSKDNFKVLFDDDSKLEDLKSTLIGKIVKVSGSIRFSSFSNRNEMIVNKVTADVNPEEEV